MFVFVQVVSRMPDIVCNANEHRGCSTQLLHLFVVQFFFKSSLLDLCIFNLTMGPSQCVFMICSFVNFFLFYFGLTDNR